MSENNLSSSGGIRARSIRAQNVVEGVQYQGSSQSADGLIRLAESISSGGIDADEILADNVVVGLQFIESREDLSVYNLGREIASLRSKVESATDEDSTIDANAAQRASAALGDAEIEAGAADPNAKRLLGRLREAVDIITSSAKAAEALGNVGSSVIKLAPLAAAIWQIAEKILGG